MSPRLYVGNILYRATKQELIDFFSQFEEVVDLYLPYNQKIRNRNRGFCFVEFASPEAASRVVEKLNGAKGLGDRPMVLRFTKVKRKNQKA